MANNKTIKTYKGFDENLCCRGFQYEVGKEYTHEGIVEACEEGFHACEQPIDVFRYYPPASSRYCEVEQSGEISKNGEDSKVASGKIKIGAEIGIPGIVKAQIEYVKAHTTTEHTDPKLAMAGFSGVATAGIRGVATAGIRGVATAGDGGAATSKGSSAVGNNGVAVARGNEVKVKGDLGSVLVLCEENEYDCNIKEWTVFVVDGEKVKPDTWYRLKDGKIEEVK